ncbi:MAG: ATP-binding protein [Infirmifilum sp.]
MRMVRLPFVPGISVEFADRDLALKRVEDWAEHGMTVVHVVYGPEGCGKSAWLRQSAVLLRELGFDVVYVNPMDKEQIIEVSVPDLRKRFMEVVERALANNTLFQIAWAAYELAHDLIKAGRRRVAVLADDVFKAIGLDKASLYVKAMLNLIEYPPRNYDVVIAVAATSEGLSRREVGRHRWAYLDAMWNMGRDGFRQLYDQIPGSKPDFEYVWRLTGGNPKLLGQLYETHWNAEPIIRRIQDEKRLPELVASLGNKERELLREAVDDPDTLISREGLPLLDKLVELNITVDSIPSRDPEFWIDEPPPERDLELGIGRRVAWQSPLHRIAVRRALDNEEGRTA